MSNRITKSNLGNTSDHPSEDDLFDLAHGLATAEDQVLFREHCATCPPCERNFHVLLADRLRSESMGPARMAGAKRRRLPLLVAAGALAAGIVLTVWLLPFQGDVATHYVVPTVELESAKRSFLVQSDIELFEKGLAAYKEDRLADAVSFLVDIEPTREFGGLRALYLSSALQRLGKPAKAVEVLRSFDVNLIPRQSRDRAHWILLSLIREDEPESAKEILALLAEPGGEFTERAQQDLDRLR